MALHKIVPPKIKKTKKKETETISYDEKYFNPTMSINSKQWSGVKDMVIGEKKVLCIKVEVNYVSSSQSEGEEKRYTADLKIIEIGEDLDKDE